MRTLIKLLVAGAVIHASWRAGSAYWTYYEFHDAVREAAQFAGNQSDREVRARVVEIASRLQVPVTDDHITVRRENNHTFIDAAYVDRIEILPRYLYPWEFKVNIDVWTGALK